MQKDPPSWSSYRTFIFRETRCQIHKVNKRKPERYIEGGSKDKVPGRKKAAGFIFLICSFTCRAALLPGALGHPKNVSADIWKWALFKWCQAQEEEAYTAAFSRQSWKRTGESPESLLNEVDVENTVHPHRVHKPHRFRVGGNAARSLAHSSRESRKKTSGMPHNSGNTKEEDGGNSSTIGTKVAEYTKSSVGPERGAKSTEAGQGGSRQLIWEFCSSERKEKDIIANRNANYN